MSDTNIEIAAQCWCDKETENITMIPALALVFANRLDDKDRVYAKEIAELKANYTKAIQDIEDWGAYASSYFQEKHNLETCIAEHKNNLIKVSK